MTSSASTGKGLTPWLMRLMVGLFALLPFEHIPTWEVGGFTLKLSYILALLLLVSVLPQINVLNKRVPLQGSDWSLLLFAGCAVLSLSASPDLKRSLLITAVWFFMFAVYWVVSRLSMDTTLRLRLEQVVLLVTTVVCLFGLYQFLGDSYGLSTELTGLRQQYTKIVFGFPRIQSVALEPLYFSNYLLVPLFIAISSYLKTKKLVNGYFWLIVLILLNIGLGISRGAYLALIVSGLGFISYLLVNYRRDKAMGAKVVGLLGCVVLAASLTMGIIYAVNGKEAGANYLGHASVEDRSTSTSVPGRLQTYKLAWELFKLKPVVGNGVASFGPLTLDNPENFKQFGYGIVNNEYLEILTETGLLGLGAFLAFLLLFLKESLRRLKQMAQPERLHLVLLLLGLVAVLVQYNFFSTLYIIYIWVFLGYARSYSLETKTT